MNCNIKLASRAAVATCPESPGVSAKAAVALSGLPTTSPCGDWGLVLQPADERGGQLILAPDAVAERAHAKANGAPEMRTEGGLAEFVAAKQRQVMRAYRGFHPWREPA